ncbi:MAG: hypothetical protein QOG97_3746 [Acidimicrobiaceae bacterium]|jgi:hypothetical protein|nr:hypothetical protein [Acidimicrobiaceae bacterium]
MVLDSLTGDRGLDFFVTFSTVTGTVGTVRQVTAG